MLDLITHIADYFHEIYRADKRPEAGRFTIGCFTIALILIGLLAFILWDVNTGTYK